MVRLKKERAQTVVSRKLMTVAVAETLSDTINNYIALNKIEVTTITPCAIDKHSNNIALPLLALTKAVERTLWHLRCAHSHDRRLQRLQKLVKGMPQISLKNSEIGKCIGCMASKLKKQAKHITEERKVTQPFQGIHMDPGFMFTHSKNKECITILESPDGHNAYFNFYCMFTEVIYGTTTNGKQPPIFYMHLLQQS